eukprot:evm.model.scf_314EXC.9 EVM.evm.TU.scf_314EXC.9   scf_314EXC:40392-45191(-)
MASQVGNVGALPTFLRRPRAHCRGCLPAVGIRFPRAAWRRCTGERRRRTVILGALAEQEAVQDSLDPALRELDRYLAGGSPIDEARAVKLMSSLQSKGLCRGFKGAQQVPKRDYSLAELRLNKIEAEKLLAPVDNTVNGVRNTVQGILLGGILALALLFRLDINELLGIVVFVLLLLGTDQVLYGGGLEALIVDILTRRFIPSYGERVAWHESGHFLIAYLVGLLPKEYTLSALDLYKRKRQLNVQAGTAFCDGAFQQEVESGTVQATSVDMVACVAVAGVMAEYQKYGFAEGGVNDIRQLDRLMRSLGVGDLLLALL